jgi:hypothetical protein
MKPALISPLFLVGFTVCFLGGMIGGLLAPLEYRLGFVLLATIGLGMFVVVVQRVHQGETSLDVERRKKLHTHSGYRLLFLLPATLTARVWAPRIADYLISSDAHPGWNLVFVVVAALAIGVVFLLLSKLLVRRKAAPAVS